MGNNQTPSCLIRPPIVIQIIRHILVVLQNFSADLQSFFLLLFRLPSHGRTKCFLDIFFCLNDRAWVNARVESRGMNERRGFKLKMHRNDAQKLRDERKKVCSILIDL